MRSLFWAARHGETRLNLSGRYRGLSNGPDAQLNEQGLQSAHDAAKFLQTLKQPFARIISSPLDRAQLTAAIIAEYFGIEQIEVDDRLLPLNVGNFAGTLKNENRIEPFLQNKNKRFPDGETINEFEHRQHSFGEYLLDRIVSQKSDFETLIVAHVSNVMFWWNLQTGANSDEYLGETSDIVLHGGVSMVTENTTIPVFKPNLKYIGIDSDHEINETSVKGEPGTGYESGAKGLFKCGNCSYYKAGSCGQKDMMEKSQRPKTKDGRIKVEEDGCCEFVDRPEEKK